VVIIILDFESTIKLIKVLIIVTALVLTDDYSAIYSGLWGYNAALTAGAVAVTFFVPTVLSFFTALMAVVFTAAAQRAVGLVLIPVKILFMFCLIYQSTIAI
jgi:urea transporter